MSKLMIKRFFASIRSVEPKTSLFKPIISVFETNQILESSLKKLSEFDDFNIPNSEKQFDGLNAQNSKTDEFNLQESLKTKKQKQFDSNTTNKKTKYNLKKKNVEKTYFLKKLNKKKKFKSSLELILNNLKNLNSKDGIESMWNQFHDTRRGFLSSSFDSNFFDTLSTRSKSFPTFVIPLRKGGEYDFYFLHFKENRVFYFKLLEPKDKSKACLVVTYFTDLKDSKGVILIQGKIDCDKNNGLQKLKLHEARELINQMQNFYVTGDEKKFKLLEKFNKSFDDFDYQELIAETQQLRI
ncbi:hypothetical protein HK099_003349 [Clydaea vesicula]|uniref:ATP synthase mitochondrial F1 complex assembly factor 1 n=1 Tax=Clydaea vesicula TaxID=447962 RepID=A0AAD5UAE2_9FUNG|nr:hypothetical protein HK099_003349 [Clydaea vesicula]